MKRFTYTPKQGRSYFKAFTLIELLVVVAIISLLSSVVLSSLRGVRENARDSRRASDFNEVRKAVNLYYNRYNDYPGKGDNSLGVIISSDCASMNHNFYQDMVGGGFLNQIPEDPGHNVPGCPSSFEMNSEYADDYFYIWDTDNLNHGDFCFGIKNFDGENAGDLEPLNQKDEVQGSVGVDNVIANAEFVYCFTDADYWSSF